MSFTLVEQLSLPGDAAKPNEDALACLIDAALVLDGATPLGPSLLPGPSDAAWIAQFGARRLAAHLKDGDPPHDALKHALADAEKSFAGLARAPIREKWQTPCAALMMAVELGHAPSPPRVHSTLVVGRGSHLSEPSAAAGPRVSEGQRGRTIEFLWFGDCAAIVAQDGKVEIIGETLKKRKAEAARARLIAREKKLSSALGVNRPEVEPLLRAARNRINSGHNWLFAPDARAAAHVARRTMTVQDDALLLIASDGFLALVSDYGAYDAAGLMAAVTDKGLAALGKELRAIEDDDARGEKFLRFKKSDDATAVLLRVN
jgi:serine/threonine protein phosphatase PrpC